MGILKETRLLGAALMVCVATITSSCSAAAPPSESEQKSAKAELLARGFTDPRWEEKIEAYTVGLGVCRFTVSTPSGTRDWALHVGDVRYANANAAMAQQHADKLGIAACFTGGTSINSP